MKSLSKGVEVIKKEPNENYRIENSITEIRKTSLHGLNSRTEDDRDTISELVGRQQNSPNLKKQRKQTGKKNDQRFRELGNDKKTPNTYIIGVPKREGMAERRLEETMVENVLNLVKDTNQKAA